MLSPLFSRLFSPLMTTDIAALNKGGGVPYPAPSGYVWDNVTENGVVVTENGQRVVTLKRIA